MPAYTNNKTIVFPCDDIDKLAHITLNLLKNNGYEVIDYSDKDKTVYVKFSGKIYGMRISQGFEI